jgi:4-amino-4-deoxy-L-arabinose transferase-like glycosyltransferase
MIAFVVLGVLIAVETPAYESSDEPGHVENIESLVSGHWYGMQANCESPCSGNEAQQGPLYYLAMAGWQKVAGVAVHAPFRGQLNLAGVYFGGKEWFQHHSAADHRFLLWLRLPNVLLGALTVLLAYFSLRLVTADPWTPVVAASLIAFLPRFVFLSSFVTNDNLVDLLGAVLVYLSLRYAKAPSPWRMAWVGLVFGLLITTKLSTLTLGLAVLALACLVPGWVKRAQFAAIGLGSALVVSSWYLIQNTVRYGDPLAGTATIRYLTKLNGLGASLAGTYVVGNPLRHVFVSVPNRIVETFWYQSGWNRSHWSWQVNVAITLAFVCALIGLVGRHVERRTLFTLGALSTAALLSVWVVSFQTGTYQARYGYFGLVAIFGLAALGLERWRLPVRFLLPLAGLIGTVVAIQHDVLAVHWT